MPPKSKVIFLHELEELPDLVGFRLPADFLEVYQLRNLGMYENMMATVHS